MIVRIHFGQGRAVRKTPGKNRHVALASAALLAPISLMAYVLGLWRLSSDLGIAREFGLRGVFSHWQLWIALGVSFHIIAFVLNRYGRGGEMHLPRVLMIRFARRGAAERDDGPKSAKAS